MIKKSIISLLFVLLCASLNLFSEEQPVASKQTQEQTLAIIKPDAVANNCIGDIIKRYEQAGLHIAAIKMVKLSKNEAAKFYAVHQKRPFFDELTSFVSFGPVIVLVLEGENAIAKNREIMGATDPAKAAKGTIRADFASSVTRNAVHGSDSPESAKEEIAFFFSQENIYAR
jgi:nucleoside-diphosphate kinase